MTARRPAREGTTQLPLHLATDDALAALRAKWSMPSNVEVQYGVKFTDYHHAKQDVMYLLDRLEAEREVTT